MCAVWCPDIIFIRILVLSLESSQLMNLNRKPSTFFVLFNSFAMFLLTRRASAFIREGSRMTLFPLRGFGKNDDIRSLSTGPPFEPRDFGKGFKIEPFVGKLDLEAFNPHPLDERVAFDELTHQYFCDGKLMEKSVTKVVEKFFRGFDPQFTAKRMVEGTNWPREGYKKRDGTPMTVEEIVTKW